MSVWFKKLANTADYDINIQLAQFDHADNACGAHRHNNFLFPDLFYL